MRFNNVTGRNTNSLLSSVTMSGLQTEADANDFNHKKKFRVISSNKTNLQVDTNRDSIDEMESEADLLEGNEKAGTNQNEANESSFALKNRTVLIAAIAGASFVIIALIVIAECKEYTDLACTFKTSATANDQNTPTARIMGGIEVPQEKFPHQILLSGESGKPHCGGTLISDQFILTAAICVQNNGIANKTVTIGGFAHSGSNSNLNVKPIKTHFHPQYNKIKFQYDISLIELSEKVKFSSTVRPICLNTKFEKYYDSVIVSGFRKKTDSSENLFLGIVEKSLDKKTEQYCRSELQNSYSLIEDTGICVTHFKDPEGVSQNLGGEPLQTKLNSTSCENTWEQLGVSTGMFGEDKYKVDGQLFTRVDLYIPWIASVVWPD